jgi:hypothetical protein
MRTIFLRAQIEDECVIMSLIYLERLLKVSGLILSPTSWRSIMLSSMIMASKVWDDLSMWNVDFSKVCKSFTLKRINELELAMLELMHVSTVVLQ